MTDKNFALIELALEGILRKLESTPKWETRRALLKEMRLLLDEADRVLSFPDEKPPLTESTLIQQESKNDSN
jgi:hypothetical protein